MSAPSTTPDADQLPDEDQPPDHVQLPETVRIAIVGSGFSGLGLAIRLLQRGERDFVVLERAEEVGGTWRDNSYPGCTCDVPSRLYSFSFAPNPGWTHTYAGQEEILAYLKSLVDRYDVRPFLRCGSELLDARWDEATSTWRLETSRGALTAAVLVAATGPLADPAVPSLPGLNSFEGNAFHSARWKHDVDLRDKRIGVVGTGASAIQFVPEIVPDADHVVVFQRTAPWVLPRSNPRVSRRRQRVHARFPAVGRVARALRYGTAEAVVVGMRGHSRVFAPLEKQGRSLLARQVPDAELRRRLTPRFAIGCKRILFSDKWYPTLVRPDVTVVSSAIEAVEPGGIRTADGVVHPLDVLIFGTGFRVTDMPIGARVRGIGGRSLDEQWQGSPQAYKGTTVAGFPNFFLLVGPNTGLGHNSLVYMIESQLAYVLGALEYLRESGTAAVQVRGEAQASYNADVQKRMRGTVWTTGGCTSWYLDRNGRNSTLWPDFSFRFRRELRAFDPEVYESCGPSG